jgi:hypothetical protein
MESKPTESESDLQEVPFEAVALVVETGEVMLAKSSHFLVPPLFDDIYFSSIHKYLSIYQIGQ